MAKRKKVDDFIVLQPLRHWPREFETDRPEAVFTADMRDTFDLLRREIKMLGASIATLRLAIEQRECIKGEKEIDPRHPGVVLEFTSKHGELTYCCDKFDEWQDNVRAITLTLERLRKAQAYGVIEGQQYQGNLALPAPQEEVLTAEDAAHWLVGYLKGACSYISVLSSEAACKKAINKAKKQAHPDAGGLEVNWHAVIKAESVLKEHFSRPLVKCG
jgi:hypothetical protein